MSAAPPTDQQGLPDTDSPGRLLIAGLNAPCSAVWAAAAASQHAEYTVATTAAACDAYARSTEPVVIVAQAATALDPRLLDPADDVFRFVPVILVTDQDAAFWRAAAWATLPQSATSDQAAEALASAWREASKRRADRQMINDFQHRLSQLSADEIAVMQAVNDARLNKQIARDQSVSVRTIEQRRRRVFEKMGVDSAVSLARLCARVETLEEQARGTHRRLDASEDGIAPPTLFSRDRRSETTLGGLLGAATLAASGGFSPLA